MDKFYFYIDFISICNFIILYCIVLYCMYMYYIIDYIVLWSSVLYCIVVGRVFFFYIIFISFWVIFGWCYCIENN